MERMNMNANEYRISEVRTAMRGFSEIMRIMNRTSDFLVRGPLHFRRMAFIAVLATVCALCMVFSTNASADTAGPNNPSTATNNTSIGSRSWSSVSNVYLSDNQNATASSLTSSSVSNYLVATGFGFAIPSGATITGIQVAVERRDGGVSSYRYVRDNSIRIVKNGSITGTDFADTSTNWPTSDGVATYGSASDLWGQTWTSSDINASNFGVAISVKGISSSSENAMIDNITITVNYTVAPAPGGSYTSGPNNPSTGSNNSSTGNTSWSNTSNVKSSDNSDASASLSGGKISNYLMAIGFGFSIPLNATITGIKVEIERAEGNQSSSAYIRDNSVKIVKGGSITGSEHADISTNWPTSDQIASYGSNSDLWGQSWTPADINAGNFGVAISAKNTSSWNSEYAYVDNMKITVYYSVASACNAAMPTVSITTAPKTITASGASVVYSVNITNNDTGSGCTSVTFNLAASDSNTTNFNTSTLDTPSVTLAPGETSSGTVLTVYGKPGQLSGTDTTTVSAAAAGHAQGSASVVTTLNVVCTLSAPTLGVSPGTQIINVNGGSVTYTLNIQNNDTAVACTTSTTFTLSVTDSNSGSFVVPSALGQSSVSLAAGANANITVTVMAKSGVNTGDNDTTINASATGHASAASNMITTSIDIPGICGTSAPMLVIEPSGTVPPGGTATFLVTVTNTDSSACSASTFTVNVVSDSNPGAFTTPSTLNPLTLTLAPGTTDSVVLSVRAANTAVQGSVNTTVVGAAAAGHASPSNVSVSTTVNSALPPTAAKLVHNSITTGSTKWSANGGWGVAGGKYGQFTCATCHMKEAPNIKRIRGVITVPDTSKGTIPGSAVSFRTTSVPGSFGDDTIAHATSNKICEVCHSQTSVHKYNQPTVALHETSFGTADCTQCHKHSQGFKPAGGCTICHSVSLGSRVAVVGQFSASSHHVQKSGTPVTDKDCYQCHWEANEDGSINDLYHGGSANPGASVKLVIYGAGTRPTTYAVGTTAVEYMANGSRTEFAKLNQVCLGCHSAQNNAIQPFGDGKTPKQYAWDGLSINERYSQMGSTTWGKYSGANVTPKNTQTKAFSAHGNAAANQRGWNLTETWPNTSGTVNVLCYDCHNSHGSSAAGKTASYTSATTSGGILKDTVAGKGGYAMTYKPQPVAQDKNSRNAGASICFDCHMTQNSGTTPWGYQNTFGSTQAILGYWEKPYWTGAAGVNPSGAQMRYPYKNAIGTAGGHFGASSGLITQTMGTIEGLCTPCHDPHGISPTLGANEAYGVPLLKGTWMTSPYKEDVAPVATNEPRGGGKKANVMNVGSTPLYHIDQNTLDITTFTTQGNDEDHSKSGTAPSWNFNSTKRVTETVDQFGGLCVKCHPKTFINPTAGGAWKSVDRIHNTVKGWGGSGANANNAVHSYTCSKCHAPHSSCLPRLMVTNCLDPTHRQQIASGGLQPILNTESGRRGQGAGHFPGGGGGNGEEPNYPGPWFFGSTGGSSGGSRDHDYGHGDGGSPSTYTRACHDNTNSDSYPANQRWNIKTPWGTPGPSQPNGGGSGGWDGGGWGR
jgi:hypothetical protein